jgi:Zn finger protein HypA/HybF involved in hydrogenase expression
MLIAYFLTGHDNGAYFLETAADELFCPNCKSCLDESYLPENIKIPKKYDIGSSYDGRDIVSARFKAFCEEHYPDEADFFPVTKKLDFYCMKPRRILVFDAEKWNTKFEGLCPVCGNYKSITGRNPGILKYQHKPIEQGFYRTDVFFGSGRGKSPVIIIGLKTKLEIQERRFSKPCFNPIYDELPPPVSRKADSP